MSESFERAATGAVLDQVRAEMDDGLNDILARVRADISDGDDPTLIWSTLVVNVVEAYHMDKNTPGPYVFASALLRLVLGKS